MALRVIFNCWLFGGSSYLQFKLTGCRWPTNLEHAAFLLEYFSTLTAQQLKYCREKSAKSPGVKLAT